MLKFTDPSLNLKLTGSEARADAHRFISRFHNTPTDPQTLFTKIPLRTKRLKGKIQ